MKTQGSTEWLETVEATMSSYRKMIDAIVEQLTDDELTIRPAAEVNSVAVILRHLGGNLQSRWADFLTTDGEKPDRDRDLEFCDWDGDRESLIAYFNRGWNTFQAALGTISEQNVDQTIHIRGEPHTVLQALMRSVTHMTYHVGQIALIARLVHDGQWNWLTIAPGKSLEHNERTWGASASRSVFSEDDETKAR